MKKLFLMTFGVFFLLQVFRSEAQSFTPGNIVVVRLGDGTPINSSTTSPIFLDEYTPAGSFVRSIALPAVDNGANLRISNLASKGTYDLLTLSAKSQFLTLVGYTLSAGSPYPGGINQASNNRTVARIGYDGIVNTSTLILGTDVITSGSTTGFPISAITDDGTGFWVVHDGNMRYVSLGQSASTSVLAVSNLKTLNIENNQLYCTRTSRPCTVSGGLPTTGPQSVTAFPGFATGFGTTAQMFFADLNPSIPGFDVLYFADDADRGISKFSYNPAASSWVLNGIIGGGTDKYRGLAGVVNGSSVTLYATRKIANDVSSGSVVGEVVTLTDNTGYTLTANSFTGSPAVIITPAANTVIRGIAMAPVKCKKPALFITNSTPVDVNVMIADSVIGGTFEYAVTTNPVPPSAGTAITAGTFSVTGLTPGTQYYVHVRRNCGGGDLSEWSRLAFTTNWPPCLPPVIFNPVPGASSIALSWQAVFTAVQYEYAVTGSATPPISGINIPGTSITPTGLSSSATYYLHVRAKCGSGDTSAWATKQFTSPCFKPTPYLIKNDFATGTADLGWNGESGVKDFQYEYAILGNEGPIGGSFNLTRDTILRLTNLRAGGKYFLHVRRKCSATSYSDWSVLEFNTSGVLVYPNPSSDFITIKVIGQGTSPNLPIYIYSSDGSLIKQVRLLNNQVNIDIQKWSAGIYFVRYGNDKGYVTTIMKK